MTGEPVDLFYSYAHKDESLRDELAGHLKIMERRGVIRSWHDRRITPGEKWDAAIDLQLTEADLILLLVSADFINSDYIWGHELDTAMKRHRSGDAAVVPVMLRAVDIQDAPFASLQGLPTDLRPVTSWPNRDEAWTNVAKGIRRTVEELQARSRPQSAAAAANFETAAPLEGVARSSAPRTRLRGPAATGSRPDPVLARVLHDFSEQISDAAIARGSPLADAGSSRKSALALIDAPDQKRVLWVDDRPENNLHEAAALAKLQVEVVQVPGTDAALARIAMDREAFDLVISDWNRPEPADGAPSAAIRLLRALRSKSGMMPFIIYHGGFAPEERHRRHELALKEGAIGEAIAPDELLALVVRALSLD